MSSDGDNDSQESEPGLHLNDPTEGEPTAFDESSVAGQTDEQLQGESNLREELDSKNDQLLRAAAEMENIRKRSRRDAEEVRKYAATGLVTDILSVLDDLQRAVESAESSGETSGLLDGVKIVASELEGVLQKHHCTKLDPLGEPFDPNLHEAIQMQPSEDYEANHVSMVARVGYRLHDRVLRPAQVFVSTGKPV